MKPRPFTLFLKRHFGDVPLVGAEIGVFVGENAQDMLERLNIKMLHLVDPYQEYPAYAKQGQKAKRAHGTGPAAAERRMMTRLVSFKGKWTTLKKSAANAAADIPDGLDFVYIDANHRYDYVKADINAYFPKVRVGGVLGGHDFGGVWKGCTKAVKEMAAELGQCLQHHTRDWWWLKEENTK